MLDPQQLRSFLAVVRQSSFTGAARALGVQQSTVSQRVRRLEAATGRQLLVRDTHSVRLTPDGEAMVGFATSLLDVQDTALAYFAASELRGTLRFGASEDFVATQLPQILRAFRRSHPLVDLQLTVGLSGVLSAQLEAGELDLMLGKRPAVGAEAPGRADVRAEVGAAARPGAEAVTGAGADAATGAEAGVRAGSARRGAGDTRSGRHRPLWRDELAWIGAAETVVPADEPVPVVCFPPPSITRALALAALDGARRPWRVTCTSTSLSGISAALRAGLGVAAHARSLIPPGLVDLGRPGGLPPLQAVEFVLDRHPSAERGPVAAAADALADAIAADIDRLR